MENSCWEMTFLKGILFILTVTLRASHSVFDEDQYLQTLEHGITMVFCLKQALFKKMMCHLTQTRAAGSSGALLFTNSEISDVSLSTYRQKK